MTDGATESSTGLAPLPPYEDSLALVRRFQASGDRELLNALLDRYYDRVRRMARIRMGVRLRQVTDSEDLVQETFAAAFSKIAQLDLADHSSLIRYLARVLENQIRGSIDHHEAQKRRPTQGRLITEDPTGASVVESLASREPTPEEHLDAKELAELYDRCVQSMPSLHREVILLREYAHAPWETIAATLDRPTPHAARLLYSRARIQLARILVQSMEDGSGARRE